jgi:DNA-binding cell septation regulator SpoVG
MEAKFYEPKYKDGKIVAFADINLDNLDNLDRGITLRGFRVIDGVNGLFAAVPSKPVTVDGQTEYVKQVVFDTNEHREEFLAKLLNDYQAWMQNRAPEANTA